jgi:glucose-6-phosphate 1-dehydrogenase
VEAAWSVVDQALHHEHPVLCYERGTWGPPDAAAVVADGEGWHDPQVETARPC